MLRRKSYLAVLAVALVVAGTGAAHAAGILGADSPNAAKAPRASWSGHRFTFERDGAATYEGEAERVRRLPAQLEKIRANPASVAEAIDDAVLASFTDLGLPHQFSHSLDHAESNDPAVGPWIAAAGDFDGDGLADALAQRLSFGTGADRLDISGVRGTDGTALWTRTFTGTRAAAAPAVVLGEPGALVFVERTKTTGTAYAARFDITLDVLALDNEGATQWRKSWTGKVTYAAGVAAHVVQVDGFPYPVGLLDADGDAVTDVAIGQDTTAYACSIAACSPESATAATTVISGAGSGSTVGESKVTDDVPPWPYVAPGITASGHDGVVYVTSRNLLHSLDAFTASGTSLWATDDVRASYWPSPVPIGNVTGSGRTDFLLWSSWAFNFGGETALVNAATGEIAWSRQVGLPFALTGGGVAGLDAVGSISPAYEWSDDLVGVTYHAIDGEGRYLYNRSYLMNAASGSSSVIEVFTELGDVDGDGTGDAGHHMVAADYSTEQFLVDSGAVSGRTGEKVWSGTPGQQIRNGGGDLVGLSFADHELIRVARIAGATGSKKWTTSVRGDELLSVDAADVNGDSTADLMIGAAEYWERYDEDWSFGYRGRPVVLDGVTGEVLWRLDELPVARAVRTEVKPYAPGQFNNTGPLPGGMVNDCSGSEASSGGSCFQLDGSERTASIAITDDLGGVVHGHWQFTDDTVPVPSFVSSGEFCGSLDNLPVPTGATLLWVFPSVDPDWCDSPSTPTSGTIKVDYR